MPEITFKKKSAFGIPQEAGGDSRENIMALRECLRETVKTNNHMDEQQLIRACVQKLWGGYMQPALNKKAGKKK